jgi:pyridoxal phosphate enzyme (YggS family)
MKNALLPILTQIQQAAIQVSRDPESITLLAVSKNQSVEKIRAVYQAGQRKFAENYVQEAIEKQKQLTDLDIEWHFIGNIQSNKTKLIANRFDWVHSVSRLAIAERLSRARDPNKPALNVCIEVNIDNEETKSGVELDAVFALVEKIKILPHLCLRGLMVIPQKNQGMAFQRTAALQQELIRAGFLLDTLSMGMSADFESAIAAGSTMLRIGTAIFGER